MSSPDARARLAARQEQLMRALMEQGPGPEACDTARLRATAEALASKRAQAVARAWPGLAADLGEGFRERFDLLMAQVPLPHAGGPLADGRTFARLLARRGELPDAGRLEAVAVDLRYLPWKGGLVPRRGIALAWTQLREPRRVVVGLRLPWLGERWFTLRLPTAGGERRLVQDRRVPSPQALMMSRTV
jgi:hypothetical protein